MSTLITAYLPAKLGFYFLFSFLLSFLFLFFSFFFAFIFFFLYFCFPFCLFFSLCPALTQTLLFFEIVFILICFHLTIGLFSLSPGSSETYSRIQITGERFPFLADMLYTTILPQRKVCSWEVYDFLKIQYWLTEKQERTNAAEFLPTITP